MQGDGDNRLCGLWAQLTPTWRVSVNVTLTQLWCGVGVGGTPLSLSLTSHGHAAPAVTPLFVMACAVRLLPVSDISRTASPRPARSRSERAPASAAVH